MSTYLGLELSIFGGKPVELYRFTVGTEVFTYCSSSTDVIYNDETYTSAPIKRSATSQESESAHDTLTVSVGIDNAVSQLFLLGSPEQVVGLTIFRMHLGGEGAVCIWKGRVTLAKWNENRCEFSCESIFSKQKQAGRGPRYTKQCRVDLYGLQCGVDKSTVAVAGTASAIDASLTIVSSDATAAFAAGYFVGGMLQTASGAARTIIRQSGSALTVSSPIMGLEIGSAITIYPGCDRSLATCNSKFGNIANYRSFAWIPSDNPFVGSVV